MKKLQTTGTGCFTAGEVRCKYEREETVMSPRVLTRDGGVNMGLGLSKHTDTGVNE